MTRTPVNNFHGVPRPISRYLLRFPQKLGAVVAVQYGRTTVHRPNAGQVSARPDSGFAFLGDRYTVAGVDVHGAQYPIEPLKGDGSEI